MNKYINTALILLLLFLNSNVKANFLDDRCYAEAKGFGPPISRLFVGKKRSNKCLGSTIPQCVGRLGPYQTIEIESNGDNIFKFLGDKNLYVGTGKDNNSIGAEWREMRVVNDKIVEEYSFVQIMEHGYSWNAKPFKHTENKGYSCESFGKCNSTLCFGLTPVEPVPQLPEPPAVVNEYGPQEISSYYFQLSMLSGCKFASKEYEYKTLEVISQWRDSQPKLIDMIKASPEYLYGLQKSQKYYEQSTPNDKQKAQKHCDNMFANFKEHQKGPDQRFSSPEKTWTLFTNSLKAGDKETVVQCLSGRARENLSAFFKSSDVDKLREMGNSFTGFSLLEPMGEFQEAAVSRSNGKAGIVMFLEKSGNWKINDM